MCTVTYVPTQNGFVFTSSRDERYDRSETEFPINENGLTFPRDLEASGSWIASNNNRLGCILNGAFVKHKRTPPYEKSRGIMLIESFNFETIDNFLSEYNFKGIEPFTFICVDSTNVHEIRWDGKSIHHKLSSLKEKQIWSSSTLYKHEIITQRELWFERWYYRKILPHLNFCRQFHYEAGKEDQNNSVLLKRETKGTISVTSIEKNHDELFMIYDDFVQPLTTIKIS